MTLESILTPEERLLVSVILRNCVQTTNPHDPGRNLQFIRNVLGYTPEGDDTILRLNDVMADFYNGVLRSFAPGGKDFRHGDVSELVIARTAAIEMSLLAEQARKSIEARECVRLRKLEQAPKEPNAL